MDAAEFRKKVEEYATPHHEDAQEAANIDLPEIYDFVVFSMSRHETMVLISAEGLGKLILQPSRSLYKKLIEQALHGVGGLDFSVSLILDDVRGDDSLSISWHGHHEP